MMSGGKRIVAMERRWFTTEKQDDMLLYTGNYRKFMNVIKREKNQSMCVERKQVSIKKGNRQIVINDMGDGNT